VSKVETSKAGSKISQLGCGTSVHGKPIEEEEEEEEEEGGGGRGGGGGGCCAVKGTQQKNITVMNFIFLLVK
jgi:hypothetical protein